MPESGSKTNLSRIVLVVAAAVVVVGTGYLHGLTTDRWGGSQALVAAAAKLSDIPTIVGDWESSELEIPDEQLQKAEAVGNLSRVYVNRTTGTAVSVMILCGRPGPISVHPPTVCFVGTGGLSLHAPPESCSVLAAQSEELGQFWRADFHKLTDGISTWMRTYWTWSPTGKWGASQSPRFEYARYPFLYKMYISRAMRRSGESVDDDPSKDFMEVFLPVLDEKLFSEQESSADA